MDIFSTADFLLLDHIHRGNKIPDVLQNRLQALVDKGIIERFGRGRGIKYILSRRYYKMIDEKGVYTRKKGLDRETNKTLLLKHIKENKDGGSRLKELMQVLPALTMSQVQKLIAELKREEKIYKIGATSAALWYPKNGNSITPVVAPMMFFHAIDNAKYNNWSQTWKSWIPKQTARRQTSSVRTLKG